MADALPKSAASQEELDRLVQETDLGGRKATGATGAVIAGACIAWSLFQLWYASPLPFETGVMVLNDTQARAVHLAFALFLAFLSFPAFKSSPRSYVPVADWVLALLGAFAGAYVYIFYRELATRPGTPTTLDLVVAGAGILLLIEATRRTSELAMVFVCAGFIAFTFLGPFMPDVIQHKGASLNKFLQHQWITTEGVYGVALGVSTSFIFLFVLFGALLDKAGGGNYMMQMSIALLGHLRGGPAKVAVVSSALNGMVSGSSVSNVVSGGIFTIPLMKRTGLSGVKAGAIEAASSINGQIMPPVMGAAAFLMVEYVGIPYSEIVKHAALPAIISYAALLYIVHLEALKIGSKPLFRATERPFKERLLWSAIGWSGTIAAFCALYYVVTGIQGAFGADAGLPLLIAGVALYVFLVWYSAKHDDLPPDLGYGSDVHLPETWAVARTGLHFVMPITVLLWCLMVEEMSPGLSAFWATVSIIAILVTQRPLYALFRGSSVGEGAWLGVREFIDGLQLGARNMIGIAIATATAGIIVGTITLTGMGLMMTDLVEYISAGNVIVMLMLTAVICLILGAGIPTTANYILVATLMAPVIVELGAQSGLAIPLIAVHLFVFYFGIMADVTPPVGLASYAASAISGEDANATGWQATIYSMRTAILPFVFIFNPEILLIGVNDWAHALIVIVSATLASLIFASVTMGYFRTRSFWWETAILALVCFTLFRPSFWMDKIIPPSQVEPSSRLEEIVNRLPKGERLVLQVEGYSLEGDEVKKTVSLPLDAEGDALARLNATGVGLAPQGGSYQITNVRFGSYAARVKLEAGQTISAVLVPSDRPPAYLFHIPALMLLGFVWWNQRRRMASE
ncbi:MAG: TRAP transporter permease [Hyphomicrobiales bacterium]|nr:TRAP transporter permease [Hyphomicrobiales bacterium]